MKKTLFIAALAIGALVSCSENDFVGDTPSPNSNNEVGAISFGTGVNTVTRAQKQGTEAATLLGNNFVLLGTKTDKATTPVTSIVFNNYQANYVENTNFTTESNSSNWEYVSYYNVPEGVTTNAGVVNFAPTDGNSDKIVQTIKYWDYGTNQYDFAAYSLGQGANSSYAKATAITKGASADAAWYTLTGTVDQLKACYISDLVTAYNVNDATNNIHISDYGKPVQFSFRSLAAKIRIGFYETIPGYSVKDVQFYTVPKNTNGDAANTAALFTSDAQKLPSGSGTMTIKFPKTGLNNRTDNDYNKAHVSFAASDNTTDLSTTLTFGVLANYPTTYEGELNTGSFIGRTSNTATYADGANAKGTYYTVLPNETGANLQLRIKYTLVSTDGYGETITVDNATAVVPAELAKWSPNYAYTYIFKIGDMTNGSTGVDGNGNIVSGLTPITLNAVVVDSEDGVQETITTVSEPSITTYMAGKVITNNDEYIANKPLYIIVNNGTENEGLTDGNAKLYTVVIQDGAAQTITEASVENAIEHGTYNSTEKTYTVTDAKNKTLVLTETGSLLAFADKIDAADSPTGNDINIGTKKVGKFTTGSAGTIYAFQYIKNANILYEDADDINTHNSNLPGAIKKTDKAYSFTSYADANGTTQYGTGKVKELSKDGEWTTVLVTSNSVEGFVGKEYKVQATTLVADTSYELYTTAGTATGIYVKVNNYEYDDTDVNTYNATLPGAVKVGDVKTPGKYAYKIIKIAQ